MLKYQDFAKQHRLSTPPVQSPSDPTPEAEADSVSVGEDRRVSTQIKSPPPKRTGELYGLFYLSAAVCQH